MKIKDWALEDRPREKLLSLGSNQLTNAELLAIILSTGTKSISALELSKAVLLKADNNLDKLASKNVAFFLKIKGIGPAKAIMIKACMEIAKRKASVQHAQSEKIQSSRDAYNNIKKRFIGLTVEEFWVLYLNRANKVIQEKRISSGGVTATIVDPKIIFHHALNCLATGLILIHNHPSGNLTPSKVDIQLTRKLKEAALNLDITVLDHLIIGNNDYLSFADEGIL